MEVLEAALEHIHQRVVPVRVRRPQKEPISQHEVLRVADDSLNHLVVIEKDPHPQARHCRSMFMEVQCTMAKVSIECLDEEDGLGIPGWHLAEFLRVSQPEHNGIDRVL